MFPATSKNKLTVLALHGDVTCYVSACFIISSLYFLASKKRYAIYMFIGFMEEDNTISDLLQEWSGGD